MKQLFKTFTMLLFVGVLFTNKLNAQITLEHTFDGVIYPCGDYYCTYSETSDHSYLTVTIYNQDYSIYKQLTIYPYEGCNIIQMSEDIFTYSFYGLQFIFVECYRYYEDGGTSVSILYDIDGNIVKKWDGTADFNFYNNKMIVYLRDWENGWVSEIYSIDGYDLNEKVMPTSFFHAYPNPARNTISLPYNLNKGEQAEMLIYDVNGKMIEKKMIDSTFDKILLNVESYTPGIYFYSVNGVSHKFVVR